MSQSRIFLIGILMAVLPLVITVVLAACGGGEEAPTSEPAAPPPNTEEPAAPTESASPPASRIDVRGDPAIGPGSTGDAVAELQRALAELGFDPGKPDGFYGAKTRKAVIAFQSKNRLQRDGLVGPKTAKAINDAIAELSEAPSG